MKKLAYNRAIVKHAKIVLFKQPPQHQTLELPQEYIQQYQSRRERGLLNPEDYAQQKDVPAGEGHMNMHDAALSALGWLGLQAAHDKAIAAVGEPPARYTPKKFLGLIPYYSDAEVNPEIADWQQRYEAAKAQAAAELDPDLQKGMERLAG